MFITVTAFSVYQLFIFNNKNENPEVIAEITTPEGQILGEEEETYQDEMGSEKYRIPQANFGGGLSMFYPGLGEPLGSLDFENVGSEVVRNKEKKELQLVVNWRTKRPTKCVVSYEKSGGSAKKIEEEFFAIEHSAVLSNLDAASTYYYTIAAEDKLGGETASDKYAVYTGAPDVSFFDLLAGAFKDAFGWAVE